MANYFVTVFDSCLLAFRTGKKGTRGLKLAAAHTDFPSFRLKPAPEVRTMGMARSILKAMAV